MSSPWDSQITSERYKLYIKLDCFSKKAHLKHHWNCPHTSGLPFLTFIAKPFQGEMKVHANKLKYQNSFKLCILFQNGQWWSVKHVNMSSQSATRRIRNVAKLTLMIIIRKMSMHSGFVCFKIAFTIGYKSTGIAEKFDFRMDLLYMLTIFIDFLKCERRTCLTLEMCWSG